MSGGPGLCPRCQAVVRPEWPYCSHCGSPLHEVVPSAPAIPVCSNCGAAVDASGAFCWKCGVPLETGREPFVPEPREATGPGGEGEPLSIPGGTLQREYRRSQSRTRRSARTPRRSVAGGLLLLAGAILVIVSVFLGWYAVSATASETIDGAHFQITATATFYPVNEVRYTDLCEGWSGCSSYNTSSTDSYSAEGLGNVGDLYDAVVALLVGSILAGVAAGILALASGRRRSNGARLFALLAVGLLAVAPVLLSADQPAAIASEGSSGMGGNMTSGPSPRTSFFGSCSDADCPGSVVSGANVSETWGPSIGWYLSLGALVPLILGLWLVRPDGSGARGQSVYDSPM